VSTAPPVRPGVVIAIFAAVALFSTTAELVGSRANGQELAIVPLLGHRLFIWLLFAALSPIAFAAARRFPIEGWRSLHRLPVHLLALLAISVLHTFIYGWVMVQAGNLNAEAWSWAVSKLTGNLRSDVFIYLPIVGGYQLFAASVRSRERDRALATARLEALKSQLQPHFLFNTLNAISTQVLKGEKEPAVRMLSRLADLLRASLSAGNHSVTLAEELELVQRYLEIEAVRFADRLRASVEASDEARAAIVPVLLLQPLVENAVRHGIAASPDAGRLAIRASRSNGVLTVEVEDDGPGPPAAISEGIGIANTRQRLRELYGERATLTLTRGRSGGAIATVRVPQ